MDFILADLIVAVVANHIVRDVSTPADGLAALQTTGITSWIADEKGKLVVLNIIT